MNAPVTQAMNDELPRLRWQCRRGMLELDLMLQNYIEHHYQQATDTDKESFKTLLTFPDQELLEYLMGQETPSNKEVAHVAQQVRKLVNVND